MTGFESFDINAWLIDGFTRHVGGNGKTIEKALRKKATSVLVAVSLLTAMVSVNEITIPVQAIAQTDIVWPRESYTGQNGAVLYPHKYWPDLMQKISTWDSIEDPAVEEPPTIL